jgi:hypothetical protein
MDPQLAATVQGKHCIMQSRGISTLLHARDAALLVPLLRGDAFFSRLEGEWWMRFSGEGAASAPALERAERRRSALHAAGMISMLHRGRT